MVRKRGLEPLRYCYRQPLKLVRLPIPPLPQSREGETLPPKENVRLYEPLFLPRWRLPLWCAPADDGPGTALANDPNHQGSEEEQDGTNGGRS